MNLTKPFYYLVILAITFLLYEQSLGLNAFLISSLSVGYLANFNWSNRSRYWWFSAILWNLSGLGLFLSHTTIGASLYIITGFHFISVNVNNQQSFPFSFVASVFSFFLGVGHFFMKKLPENDQIEAGTTEKSIVKKILIYTIPLFIVLFFLKLYQFANPDFAELTAFISLEFIEWQFFILYGLLMIFLYGIYNFHLWEQIKTWDKNSSNTISKGYKDTIQDSLGLDGENKMAVMLIGTLTLLLITFLVIDANTLFFGAEQTLTHSEYVHLGINILITSIVFVILIVTYVFRGGLNFTDNRFVKLLTYVWLGLNLILTGFNAIKNFNYISDWGMTHKRIGVYIYLSLCVIGLIITIYKVRSKQSFVFIIRKVSISFMTVLVVFSLINWNGFIANYNLNDQRFEVHKVDLIYNLNLGPEAYPAVLNYIQKHKGEVDIYAVDEFDYLITRFKRNYYQSWRDFPSLKISDLMINNALLDYQPRY